MDGKDILTVNQLVDEYPAFPEATVRWWIYNRARNGFEKCLLRIGGRLYIDRAALLNWLKSHRLVHDSSELV